MVGETRHRRDAFSEDRRRYLTETTPIRVRFHEVDSMHIVWHGHYVTYFEDARRAFGRRYGIDYPIFAKNKIGAPVVKIWIDYLSPALANDELEVEARLYESDGARIEFGYEIRREATRALLATGGSVQVFSSLQGELMLTWPTVVRECLDAWKDLWIDPSL